MLDSPLTLQEGRFARLEAIQWWNQSQLEAARVLVIGAGALGNEVIKNLALLGVGHVVVVDMDRIESSNLCRSVLFREGDEGCFKAERAAQGAREIYSAAGVVPVIGNITTDLGLGYFHWAQIVVGAVDNREARVFINSVCARVGRPWIDGGIEVLQGIVRGFAPPATACYECTMGQTDWELLNQRRSCSLLARRAISQRGVATTPITASVIGAMQVSEVIKILHGLEALAGRGFIFDGLGHTSYPVAYPINPDCRWHEPPSEIVALAAGSDTPLSTIRDMAVGMLGAVDALEVVREIVTTLTCPACGRQEQVYRQAAKISEDQLICRACGAECRPEFLHTLYGQSDLLALTPAELGLPRWEILWARHGETYLGLELAGDRPAEVAGSTMMGVHR